MTVSNLFLRFGVLSLIVGVSLGVWMGASHDFALRPVHAHINLIGWASMMIFGLVYRAMPEAGEGWLPRAQLVTAVIGMPLMMAGLAAMLLNQTALLPVMLIGELLVAVSIVLFAVVLFRATGGNPVAA